MNAQALAWFVVAFIVIRLIYPIPGRKPKPVAPAPVRPPLVVTDDDGIVTYEARAKWLPADIRADVEEAVDAERGVSWEEHEVMRFGSDVPVRDRSG